MTDPPRIEPLPEREWDDEIRALIEQSWEGPPPGNRNNLFRTFAKRRDLFGPWSEFGRAVYRGRLSHRDRELLVLRVAWLTQCRFQWAFHEPLARRIGMTREEIARVVEGPGAAGWEARESSLLRAADELHESSRISDGTWGELERWYDEGERIEIPVVVGGYTLVAQLTNALRIAPGDRLPSLPVAAGSR
jgi:AhpD family alkylhydroperoxidase